MSADGAKQTSKRLCVRSIAGPRSRHSVPRPGITSLCNVAGRFRPWASFFISTISVTTVLRRKTAAAGRRGAWSRWCARTSHVSRLVIAGDLGFRHGPLAFCSQWTGCKKQPALPHWLGAEAKAGKNATVNGGFKKETASAGRLRRLQLYTTDGGRGVVAPRPIDVR